MGKTDNSLTNMFPIFFGSYNTSIYFVGEEEEEENLFSEKKGCPFFGWSKGKTFPTFLEPPSFLNIQETFTGSSGSPGEDGSLLVWCPSSGT